MSVNVAGGIFDKLALLHYKVTAKVRTVEPL